jgi:exopolysaccharide production protein ExoY
MREGITSRFSYFRRRGVAETQWDTAAATSSRAVADSTSALPGPWSTVRLSRTGKNTGSAVGGRSKRCFDIGAAATAILCLIPLFCLIALAIKLMDRGPVFYRHRRIGRDGMQFDCLKFRTMAVDADQVLHRHLAANRDAAREWEEKHKLTDDPRITSLGIVLRKSSLDELPQLLNILKGEMSVVGPRPIVVAEVPKYGDCMGHYLRARPGLTGPWQVSGRNDVGYESRVQLDRQYVESWSFRRDLVIICATIRVVVTARGCY